ncbi:poly polymerase tankyrase [Caerostris extrusa]|uniref:Poly polymerase tankyrase n=1 Tax=Caerostris extrusa TaxID=172846 RepID=A0AAV4VSR4_CAEEX|nr:poly polymerase tankyrase [Caerostris extrusa]
MPSTRRVAVRENEHRTKRTRPPPVLEPEPQDLRIATSVVMDQNVETNGCDDGPISLAVSNHNDVVACATKTDKQMAKSLSAQEGKRNPRQAASNAKGNRARLGILLQILPTLLLRHLLLLKGGPLAICLTFSYQTAGTGTAPVLSQETTITSPTNLRLVKNAQQSQLHSSPPTLKSQKRNLKRQSEAADLDGARAERVNECAFSTQPFQSPPPPTIIPAILRQQVIKTPEDKIVVFNKGEFLAVRNENGSFFVCRTAQNVYKSSKRFKIQWMSDKESDIYIPDFYDQTDFECVLTNLRLKRLDKNKFQLPSEERQRTLNILQRALNVENGMDISQLQVTTDGVDVSIVGKEDEEILRLQQETLKTEQKNKISQLRTKAATRAANRGRPKRPEPIARMTKASTAGKTQSEETVKVKLKKEGGRIIVSNKARKPVTKLKKIAERLHPNPKVTLFEKILLLKRTFKFHMYPHQLIKEKYANPPQTLLEHQRSGRYNMAMLGHAVKPIAASRGGREGNNAFLKDINFCDKTYPSVTDDLLIEALKSGVSMATFKFLLSQNNDDYQSWYSWKNGKLLDHIHIAVRNGYYKLAGQLVKEALERGGYGFNNLHKEVLLNDRQPLTPFKTVSIVKKCQGNARITPLHCAAINPNSQYLTALLSSTPEYNLPDENGWRPIHYASVCKSTGPLELLISRNVSLEEPESDGNTALHVAALAGRAQNVDLILRHLIASEHNRKETAITVSLQDKQSCQRGHTDVVKVLIKHKANVDKLTNAQHDKLTPLMFASQKGHLDVVKLLVEHNAQIKQRTALTHAVINGHTHITSFLLRLGANPNATDTSGNTLVHYAAAYGWYFSLKLLIEAGASLNLKNDWKITPLSLAFMKGHMGLVDFLVEQPGIDINVDFSNDSGMSLVMQALRSRITHSMLERIHFLVVKQKSDCTKLDFMGNNALHHLVMAEVGEVYIDAKAQQEHDDLIQEITKLLLDHGCDPMVRNKEGESPFNLAVKEGCLLLVKMFLDAGCELNLDVSHSGDNILHYLVTHARNRKVEPMLQAILNAKCSSPDSTPHQLLCQMAKMYNKNGHTPLLQALHTLGSCRDKESQNRLLTFAKVLLDELGADVSAPCKKEDGKEASYALHLGTKCDGGRVIEVLLAHKPPLNVFDEHGQSPLILAIKEENTEAVEALIKAGANVNLKSNDEDKISPLLLASKNVKLGKIVQLLVHNKADVCDVDKKNKNTALHYVVSVRAQNVLETGKTLLTAGADVNALNDKQRTPLHLSINASKSDTDSSYSIEECLLGFGARLDALDCRHRIPLHYAFVKINKPFDCSVIDPMELISLLTDSMSKESLAIADDFGRTPLHYAAYRGATTCVCHLIKLCSNVEYRDKDGNTALGLAVKNNHFSVVMHLLQSGANCVADIISPVESIKRKGPEPLKWVHAKKPPAVPEKHTIFAGETLLKDWQGILFVMLGQLDALKKGINIAVEAALRTAKYNVALKLIGRIKNSWMLYSEKQSMLHVLAREAPPDYLPELQVKVAQFLIEKGVPVMAKDEHGCSVLTYAAVNRNHTLCSFFATKMSLPVASKLDPDRSLRTPFSAIFWKLTSEDLSDDIRNWCCNLIKAGANPNVLTQYPIEMNSFPGVRCTILNSLHIEDPNAPKYTPLIMAIYQSNYTVVKLLLNKGADVNFSDDKKRSPLMHAVRLNDIKMVKLLLNFNYDPSKDKNPYKCTANLAAQDVNGWTVVHYIVDPLPDYCYANTSLLNFLAELGAPLDTVNVAGESALQIATRLQRDILVTALEKLLNTPTGPKDKNRAF